MDTNQRRTLDLFGYTFEDTTKPTPHMDFMTKEGVILKGLPCDSYHLRRYLSKGFKPIKNKEESK